MPTCMIEADAASLEDDSVAVAQIKAQMSFQPYYVVKMTAFHSFDFMEMKLHMKNKKIQKVKVFVSSTTSDLCNDWPSVLSHRGGYCTVCFAFAQYPASRKQCLSS